MSADELDALSDRLDAETRTLAALRRNPSATAAQIAAQDEIAHDLDAKLLVLGIEFARHDYYNPQPARRRTRRARGAL